MDVPDSYWLVADEDCLLPDWHSIVETHGQMALQTSWRLLGNAADAEECVQESLFDAFRMHSRETINNWGD